MMDRSWHTSADVRRCFAAKAAPWYQLPWGGRAQQVPGCPVNLRIPNVENIEEHSNAFLLPSTVPGIEAPSPSSSSKKGGTQNTPWGPWGQIHHRTQGPGEPMSQGTVQTRWRAAGYAQGRLLPAAEHLQGSKACPLLLLFSFHSSRGVYSELL